jgi:hypothetical protein
VVVDVGIGLLVNLRLRLLQVVLVVARVGAQALNVLDHVVGAIAAGGGARAVGGLLLVGGGRHRRGLHARRGGDEGGCGGREVGTTALTARPNK